MRTGLIILTTVMLMAGGWGLLSAQNMISDDLPDNLVPSDVDRIYSLGDNEDELLDIDPAHERKLLTTNKQSLTIGAARDLGEGKFSEVHTGFSGGIGLPPQIDYELDSRAMELTGNDLSASPSAFEEFSMEESAPIMQAGFEEQPVPGRSSRIQQVSSAEDNPFLKMSAQQNNNIETTTSPESAPAFPSFPEFAAEDATDESDELDELDEADELKESPPFQLMLPPTETAETKESFEPAPSFDLVPESEKVVGGAPTVSPSSYTASRFAPAPWASMAVQGPITPSIATRWVNNGVMNVGQKTECELQVRNIGATPVHDFLLDAVLPAHVELVAVEPEVALKDGQLTWHVDHLKGDEQLSFKVVFIPRKRGPLMAEAHVRYSAMTSAAFHVEEPMLQIALEGSNKVMIGEAATQIITVANPGTGVAQNVIIHADIPAGLEHAQGQNVSLPVGSLNPGEKRRIRLPLVCVAGGQQELAVSAVAESGLTEKARVTVDVVAPELALLAEGPRLRFVGRTATYRLTVKNTGSAESSNVRLLHKVPEGFNFVQADKSGKFDESTRVVQWFVGRLEPEQTAVVQVQLEATALGDAEQRFAAVSDQAARSEATVKTEVDGTPSLVLEILDLDDPVEVGRETAYEIRVSNIGSKAAQQVDISCELPEGVAFQSARGPSAHREDGTKVVFKPLAILPAGETAIYRVHVVGNVAGKQNISVEMKSRDDDEPLVYTEQTRYYQD